MILSAMTSQHPRSEKAEERCSRNRQQLSVLVASEVEVKDELVHRLKKR